MIASRVRWLKVVLLLSSVAAFVLLLVAAYEENFTAQWRTHQKNYARLQAKQGQSKAEYPIEIRQVFLEEWNRIDRCVTCHTGIDNPAMKDEEQFGRVLRVLRPNQSATLRAD